jgi:hypothetical protein
MIMARRRIFAELIEGVEAMKQHREGKLTQRSYRMEATPLPAVNALKTRAEFSDWRIEKTKRGKVKTRTL